MKPSAAAALTERQQKILLLLVRDYIETAQPVSSGRLVRRYGLPYSSATVRNELATLTELGYLQQPHTSAGRVPAEAGYRFFVTELLAGAELPPQARTEIRQAFLSVRPEPEAWAQVAAEVLAHYARAVALVTAPHTEQVRFKHLELIATRGRQALMVLVLEGGEVLQRLLALPEPVAQPRLSQIAGRFNEMLTGCTPEQIRQYPSPESPLEAAVWALVCDDLESVASRQTGEVYLDGIAHVIEAPEFRQQERASRTLRLLEERQTLQSLLVQVAPENRVGGVQVLLGAPRPWEALEQCALVLSRYGVPGLMTGTLGVVGPMRMPYSRAIPAVRYVSGVLSDLVTETIIGEEPYEQEDQS